MKVDSVCIRDRQFEHGNFQFVGQGGAGPITMHEQQQHAVHHDL